MQLLPILLVAAVLAADGGLRLIDRPGWLTPLASSALVIGPVLLILALAWMRLAWCRRALDRGRGAAAIIAADRAARLARALILLNHAAALLAFDWLGVVRSWTGDLVLVDETVALLPALGGVMGLWWLHYPLDRRVREALLIRRLDLGRPVYPMPPRGTYVLLQLRLHMLLLLVPLLLIIALAEVIRSLVPADPDPHASVTLRDGLTFLAGVGVFVTAPLLGRWLLSVDVLGPGPLRDDLLEICRRHRVRVRELLLWKTSGTMINAAVMGVVGRLRFVLLTDALLEVMPREQVLAVMAHEIGHVRRHHMPWLIASLLAAIGLTWLVQLPLLLPGAPGADWRGGGGRILELGLVGGQLVIALGAFGWVSRRFERQADTFAVQHFSGLGDHHPDAADQDDAEAEHQPEDADQSSPILEERRVSTVAVEAMIGALDLIARLNAMNPRRRSWRHGSIEWRQAYLRSIIGRPLVGLPIDRVVRRVKLATVVVLLATGGGILWVERGLSPEHPAAPDPDAAISMRHTP
ncbi:MAG: M48 family metallopeptidase [Planctomycetota bacterium]|jgi:Zn-dependent protease with chaperone function